MNQQSTRTLIFVGVAAVCVAGAFGTSAVNRPAKLDDTVQVGEQFYPEFTDPTKATSLRVAHYDKDSTQVKLFNVEFKNGLWRIPSHHDYPADGEKQLADTAGSVIGIERGAYSGKSPDDQKRLGVLDPLDESVTGSEGRGDRITLTEGDKVVVDFIIGKPVPDMENTYYVRRADEPRVYRAKLDNLKVSTKFSDWIEQDLLEVQSSKITDLVVNRYHVDESRGAIVQEEVNHLLKDDKSTWALEGLNAETEKVKTSTVSSMTYALQDLKIVGVRPKPAGLSAALRGEEGGLSQFDIIEMQQRGFYVAGGDLVSNEGEILAGTNEGIRYTLRFGKVFTGSDIEIEAGNSHDGAEKKTDTTDSDGEKTDAADADAATTPADDADAEPKESDESDTSLQKSRYVLIRAQFDESLLGARPVAPVKPEPPGEAAASEADPAGNDADQDKPAEGSAATDQPEAAQPEKTDATQPEGSVDDPKTEGTDETRPDAAAEEKPAETKPDPKAEYDAALKKYEADQRDFEQKNKAFDEKIAAGKKLAAELDLRFANWYYVIDAAQFDKLHVQRADLVEPKEPPKTTTPAAGEASPGSGAAATSPPAPPTVEAGETPKTDDAVKPEGSPAEKTPPGGADPPKADGDAAAPAADNKTDAPAGEKLPESRGEAPPAGGAKPPADNDSPPGQAP